MAFLGDLAAGTLGVRVVPPAGTVVEDNPDHARLRDEQSGLSWMLTFNKGLQLDLGMDHWNELVIDARRQTRALFESLIKGARWPRLEDPEFSPLIEIERFVLPGGAGLSVLFRSHFEPGFETVTGHTLVPTARGVFHARWVAGTHQTGFRESLLFMTARMQGRDMPTLDFFDAAVHDEQFPHHVLSIARSAKLWWRDRLELTAPPPPPQRGEITVPQLACTVTLPPRFAPRDVVRYDFGPAAYFSRASFSSHDGIDQLQVARFDERLGDSFQAELYIARSARTEASELTSGWENVTVKVEKGRSHMAPWLPSTIVVAEATRPDHPRTRILWEWSCAERTHQIWKIFLYTTTAIPVDEMREIVQAVRDSLRFEPS